MKNFILYATVFCLAVMVSCTDQLRIDERQVNFDSQYFSYSKYQLTSSIAKTAYSYGKGVVDAKKGETNWYFINCYSGDQLQSFGTASKAWEAENGQNLYTDVFRNLKALEDLAKSENNQANIAASKILRCVNIAFLTEKYGDVPFSEANLGREGNVFPKFDSQKAVYEGMFTMLDEAVKTLADGSSTGLPSDQDILYKGDKTKWIKFANSLKFRLMMHSYSAFKAAGTDLASKLQEIAASGNYLSAVTDDAALTFPAASNDDSWYLNTTYNTLNSYTSFKPTKILIDKLVALDDPRLYVIFAPALSPLSAQTTKSDEAVKINGYSYTITHDPASKYTFSAETSYDESGTQISVDYPLDVKWFGTPRTANINNLYASSSAVAGTNSSYDNRRLSGLSQLFTLKNDPRLKATLMESSEMAFLLAEARQKSLISTGTVQGYYEAGIKLSFGRWQITDGTKPASYLNSDKIVLSFSDYLAQSTVKLDGTSADLDKIYLQKWFANLLTNHTEEYTEIRRTGKPAFTKILPTKFSVNAYPYRYLYPFDEQNNNKTNYDAAVSILGGDLNSSKMWIFK